MVSATGTCATLHKTAASICTIKTYNALVAVCNSAIYKSGTHGAFELPMQSGTHIYVLYCASNHNFVCSTLIVLLKLFVQMAEF